MFGSKFVKTFFLLTFGLIGDWGSALSVVAGYVLALMPKKCSDHVQLELPRFDMSCSTWQCTWSKFSLSIWNCGNTWTWSYCQQNNILSLSNVTQQILIKFVILHSLRCAQHRDRMYPMTSPGYQAIQTQITYGPPWFSRECVCLRSFSSNQLYFYKAHHEARRKCPS